MKYTSTFSSAVRLVFGVAFMILSATTSVRAQTPSDEQSKTKFADKIGHWLYAYGMSSPDFLPEDRAAFKEKAFAEVYVEATINYDAWMFNLLNKVTKFRYPAKQMPHIVFEVKFTPTDATLTKYNIAFAIQATSEVSVNLQNIATEAAASLSGKTYTEPAQAVADIEKAIKAALTTLAEKLGDELAPNLLVRYANEVFWDGHEIPVMEGEGNYAELEAVDKTGASINASLLTWTNADPFESKGVVDMTGVNAKEVTLVKTGEENSPLRVTLKRVGTSEDINELLKMLIVEVLTQKKRQAQDTIVILKTDSTNNARDVSTQIALLEKDNLQMEDDGQRYTPLFSSPQVLQNESHFNADHQRVRGFELLRKRKNLTNAIRRKINVVAFADLVVENPEKVRDLLDELLRSSGRLIARLIMNKDSNGQRDEARNIVIEFLNNNLERIAGNQYPESLTVENPLPPIVITVTPPAYQPGQFIHINPHVAFEGRETFIKEMSDYLAQLDTPTFVTINYSQDVSTQSYLSRTTGIRPRGLPDNYKYISITLVNIPGSVQWQITGSKQASVEEGANIATALKSYIQQDAAVLHIGTTARQQVTRLFESIRCAYLSGSMVSYNNPSGNLFDFDDFILTPSKKLGNIKILYRKYDGNPFLDNHIRFDLKTITDIKPDEAFFKTWYFEYHEVSIGRIVFASDNKGDLELLKRYLQPTSAEWKAESQQRLANIESKITSPESLEELKDIIYSYPCLLDLVTSVNLKFEIIKRIGAQWFIEGQSEVVLINTLNSVKEKEAATTMLTKLSGTAGLLSKLDSRFDTEEYDDYYAALVKLFLRSNSLDTQETLSSIESIVSQEQYDALLDNDLRFGEYLSKNGILLWSDPGYIKFFTETGLTAIDYQDFEIAENGKVTFEVDHINWTGSDYDFPITWDPFKPVVVFVLTSSSEINPYTSEVLFRGQALILPAIAINQLNKVENVNAFMRIFDAVTFAIPVAYSLKTARYIYLGTEVLLFSLQQVMEDYSAELGATEAGKKVLRAWMVFNLLYTVHELGGGANGLKRSMDNLLNKVDDYAEQGGTASKEVASKIKFFVTKNLDELVANLDADLKNTFQYLLSTGLRAEAKGSTIMMKNGSNETIALIYNNKLTPTKWGAAYKFPDTKKTVTAQGYIVINDNNTLTFDLGFKKDGGRKLEAREVNDYLVHGQGKDLDGQPYWAGTEVEEMVLDQNSEYVHFVEILNIRDGIPTPRPGQYASRESINSIAELRQKLAVKEAWKPTAERPTVRTYRVKKSLRVRSGTIGPQTENGVHLSGGGHQYEVVDDLQGTKWKDYLELVSIKELK
jgi:hypothetical protein